MEMSGEDRLPEQGTRDGVNKSSATSIVEGRPSCVVSVEVAKEERISIGAVEERV